MSFEPRDFLARFLKVLNDRDYERLSDFVHPDYEGFFPQSGERMRGPAAWRGQMENFPGGLEPNSIADDARVLGEERWALTPAFTVVPLATGTEFTVIARTRYPDGAIWSLVNLVTLRDGRIYRMETFFAPELAAPLAESIAGWPKA
jgi:SnoaL-like domain